MVKILCKIILKTDFRGNAVALFSTGLIIWRQRVVSVYHVRNFDLWKNVVVWGG